MLPLDYSQTGTSTVGGGKGTVLSEKVSGELVSSVACEEWFVECLAFSADRPDHLILFKKYVSRQAAKKGRAVLEGVGLHTEAIDACFGNASEEDAVQDGLIKWKDGQGTQPPTWCVLLDAMEYAAIAQEHVQGLTRKLGLLGMLLH